MGRRWVRVVGAVGAFLLLTCTTHRLPERGASPRAEAQAVVDGSPVTITGEVFDADGHAAAGCPVRVYYRGPDDRPRVVAFPADDRGRLSMGIRVQDPYEPVYVLAHREGLALDWQGLIPGNAALLRLGSEPQTCAGVVTDPAGAPVAGARIALHLVSLPSPYGYVDPDGYPAYPCVAQTDLQGRFRVGGLASRPLRVSVLADGYAGRTAYVRKDDDPTQLTIRLDPEAMIRGRVVRDGRPVCRVPVSCRLENGSAGGGSDRSYTDAEGIYSLRHLWYGTFIVSADAHGGLVGSAIQGITLGEGEHRTIRDIRLTPGGLVRGQVTDEGTHTPVQGARVGADGGSRFGVRPALTDADGRYELRLPPGQQRIRVLWPGHPWPHCPVKDHDTATLTLADGQAVSGIDFSMKQWGWPLEPPPLKMAITFIPPEIAAYEPLVARVTETTAAGEALWAGGWDHLSCRIQVRDCSGNLLAITPRQTMPIDFVPGGTSAPPGGTVVQDMVISALYTFSEPGEYEVRVQQLRLQEHFPVDAEVSARVRVLPFDGARLEARCRELAGMERSRGKFEWFYALCSVRHDVVLPYLDQWVGNTEASHAIMAIDSAAARAKFEALLARQDRVGKTARWVRDDEATRPRYRWPWGVLGQAWVSPSG